MRRPHEIVDALPLEHERAFVVAPGRDAFHPGGVERNHVVVQPDHVAVALPEIEVGGAVLINEHHRVDGLTFKRPPGDKRFNNYREYVKLDLIFIDQ